MRLISQIICHLAIAAWANTHSLNQWLGTAHEFIGSWMALLISAGISHKAGDLAEIVRLCPHGLFRLTWTCSHSNGREAMEETETWILFQVSASSLLLPDWSMQITLLRPGSEWEGTKGYRGKGTDRYRRLLIRARKSLFSSANSGRARIWAGFFRFQSI